MSTVAPPSSPARIEEAHGRIRHPLDRLRKYINTYVFFEALGLIGLVLALAFWAGFWLDFGVFKVTNFDWVQVDSRGFLRGFVLCTFTVLMLALVVFVVSTRFFKEFRDSALAMVLEKRFPKELGGRVITAVELHNPKQAAAYGYSPSLVAQTIHEAAERVETVPVAEVFAWKRLYTYGFVLLYLTIGTYLLTGVAFCASRAAENRAARIRAARNGTVVAPESLHPAATGFHDFHDVAIIWAERNLLLRNVIWPRAAHIELIPLDPREKTETGYEARIARDQPPPTLRARAWKYVRTDRTHPEGLRLLTWDDLLNDRSMASGVEVPQIVARWVPRDEDVGLTVDEVELKIEAFPVRTRLPGGQGLDLSVPLIDQSKLEVLTNTPLTLDLHWREAFDKDAQVIAVTLGDQTVSDYEITPEKTIRFTVAGLSETQKLTVTVKDRQDVEAARDKDKVKPKFAATVTLEARATSFFTLESDGKWRRLSWADLTQERLAGLPVETLPAEWNPASRVAGLMGMGAGFDAVVRSAVDAKLQNLLIDDVKDFAAADEKEVDPLLKELEGPLKEVNASLKEVDGPLQKMKASLKEVEDVLAKGENDAAALDKARVRKAELEASMAPLLARKAPLDARKAELETRKAPLDVRKLRAVNVRKACDFLDHLSALRETLAGVETRSNQRGMRRTMRKLEVPTFATLYYSGKKTSSLVTMNKVADNEYTGTFADLKETVSYHVVGLDYRTPTKRLIVVELPRLEKLESEEERPAYLYYRPTDPWKPGEMRGKRQKFAPIGVSLSGDASTLEVPMSTSLTLTGLSSKPLRNVTIVEYEKLKTLLAALRPAFAGMLAAEAKQEKRKAEPWIPAAGQLVKTASMDVADVPAIVKELSSTEGGNDLEAIAAALAAGGEQGKRLTALFEQARTADKTLVDTVPDLNALARLIKDVRETIKNQVLIHLGTPRLTGTAEKTFGLVVGDLRREQKFTLEFEDTDDVKGRRAVLIQPREDVAPRIREFNPDDVIRKGKEGYLVTANARIPFKGRVRDDHGLARVRFACRVTPADFMSEQKFLALNGVGAILPLGRPETRLLGMMFMGLTNRMVANAAVDESGEEQLIDLPVFQMELEKNKLRDGRSELLAAETVKGLLEKKQREPYRRLMGDFILAPDKWTDNDEEPNEPRRWVNAQDPRAPLYFDLPLFHKNLRYQGEPLKERDDAKPQKRYLVEVRLLADDVYTEGPEFIPSVIFDARREDERDRLKKAIDVLRPYAIAARPLKRAENAPLSPLENLALVLGDKPGAVDLVSIGKGLVTPEADVMLAQAAMAVAGNDRGLKAIADIRELTKEREPAPHTSPSSETFSFMVVPEHELMSRIGEEEEAKQRDLMKMMKPITDARDRMSDASLMLSANANEQILNSVLARCDTVDDTLKTAHADAISVRNAYDRIVREQRLNQMTPGVTAKMFREVALPLGKVTDVHFDRAINAVRTLRRSVDSKEGTVAARARDAGPKAAEAQKQLDTLVNELRNIIDKMKGITELRELILILEDVYSQESKLHDLMRQLYKKAVEDAIKQP